MAGSNLEKYSLTAASVSASVISLMSLSHEKGVEKAWLARPTSEKRVNRRMVAAIGEVREAANLPLYFMIADSTSGTCNVSLPQDATVCPSRNKGRESQAKSWKNA